MKFLALASFFVLPALVVSQTPTSDEVPAPAHSFMVEAYESPFPRGSGLSGHTLVADAGLLWLTNSSRGISAATAWISVNNTGKATLLKPTRAPIYLETYNGMLHYYGSKFVSPVEPSVVNFLHLGRGSVVNSTGATFAWHGTDNEYWFACQDPLSEPGWYHVIKAFGGGRGVSTCKPVLLNAITF